MMLRKSISKSLKSWASRAVTSSVNLSPPRAPPRLLGRRRARPIPAPGSGGVNIEHERKQVKVQLIICLFAVLVALGPRM